MYLKTFGICLVVGWALGAPPRGDDAKDPVPPTKVKKIDCKEMEKKLKLDGSFDFCVKIGFPKGKGQRPKVLYGGLTIFVDDQGNKIKNVYNGKVIAKKAGKWLPVEETRISMTVKPDVDIATMMINDGEELYELKVDLERGEAEPDHLPKDYDKIDDEEPFPEEKDRWNDQALRRKFVNAYKAQKSKPKSVLLKIQFVAEKYFVDEYGSEGAVNTRIQEVYNHLKTMYSHHSLPIVINVESLPVKYLNQQVLITADNRDAFGQYAARQVRYGTWPQADTYILLGPKNEGGLYGIANSGWTLNGGVCATDVAKKVSINWYEASTWRTKGYNDDLLTALTVVHENGHNLGMRHDFKDIKNKPTRYALTNRRCKGVRGFMDYVFPPYTEDNQVPDRWSDCSGEDWEAHYMQEVEARGKYCLQTTCDNGPCDWEKPEPEPEPEPETSSCKDKNTRCWRYTSLCTSNGWVKENCKATCNLCCKDENSNCSLYTNLCSSNSWVQTNCKATCKIC